MVTKGIIKTLDLTGNTCTVRLPLFETAGNDHIIGTATISNTPGSYNGYKEGDVVWVAFEDGSMNSPVVIGKLYLGVEEERKDPRGVLNVENSTVAKTASMPADTKLSVQTDHNIPNTTSPFGSLSSIANNLNALNTSVAQNNRDYGNKFKQVASEIDNQGTQFRSSLTQTAKEIRAEVSAIETDLDGKITDTNSALTQTAGEIRAEVNQVEIELDGKITATNSKLDLTADNINAEVSTKVSSNSDTTEQAFGWNLKSDEWTVYNKTNEIVTNVTDLWVDIVQKVVKVEETAEDGTTTEKDIVKQYYAINNIITTREVGTETSLPTIESTGDSIAPWAWADTGSLINVLTESPETVYLTNVPKVKKVLIANETGLEVRGKIEAERGHIGSFTIGDEFNGHSGIYSDNYKDKHNNYITSFKNNNTGKDWEFEENAEGVYVGTDGIRLGPNFSVDPTGEVTATGLRINLTDEQKNKLKGETTLYYMYSSDGQNHPAENLDDWKTTIPATPTGSTLETTPYLWTKTVTEYEWIIDGESNYTVSYNVSKVGVNTYSEIQYKLSTSSEDEEVYDDEWSTDIKVPTKTVPYVWTRTVTYYSDTNGVKSTGKASLYDSFDSLISILSVDGIDIISSTGTGNDKEYHLKADTLSGAVSDQVTIGGFTIGNTQLHAGAGSGVVSLQTSNADKGQLTYISAEYIESNGTQYIDTKVKYDPSKIYVVDIKISYNTVSPTNQICGFTANRGCGIGTATNKWWAEGTSPESEVKTNQIYNLKFVKGTDNSPDYFERWVDGNKIDYGTGGNTTITSNTFWLLSTPEKTNGIFDYSSHSKLYSCQIYENGTLIRNFKPALKNNKYGLYDSCTGEFFGNSGSGLLTGNLTPEYASSFTMNGVNYTRLDYIKNVVNDETDENKANYIEFPSLSFDKSTGLKLEMVVEPVANTSKAGTTESRCAFFSSYSSTNQDSSHISIELHTSGSTNNLTRVYVDGQDRLNTSSLPGAPGISPNIKNKIVVQLENGKGNLKLNDTYSYTTDSDKNFGTTGAWEGPFRIFVDNHNGGRFGVFTNPFKLYSVNIYKGTQLTTKLVPVLNEQTQTPGLINLLTGTFYPNAAGAKFEYGEYTTGGKTFVGSGDDNINTYRVLEYIEGTGSQYIKTGWKLNPATDSFEIVSQATESPQDGGILGAYTNTTFMLYHTTNNNDMIGLWGYYKKDSSASSYTYGYLDTGCTATDLNKHAFKYEPVKIYTDGTKIDEKAEAKSLASDELFMFALNNGGTASNYYKGRIYSCKIWQGDTLKRDYIPVVKNETEYGMYDLVEPKFYPKKGSGSFKGKGAAEEFTAFYLGAPDAENAPFSVTNTGKMKATSGTIGKFSLHDGVLEAGTRGGASSIIVSANGQTATIGNSYAHDWMLTVGRGFGVDSTGKVNVTDGMFNGTLNTTECFLNNVKQFNFVGDSLQIGGMSLTNTITNVDSTTTTSANFTLLTDDRDDSSYNAAFCSGASYIGSNTLYSLAFTCDKTLGEQVTLDYIVTKTSWVAYSNGYPVYNTIEFNQPLTFLKGTNKLKVNAIGNDRGMYGNWKLNFIILKKTSDNTTLTIYPKNTFTNNITTTTASSEILLACSGGFIPVERNAGNLGTSEYRWGNIFGANIDAQGTLVARDTSGNEKFKVDSSGNITAAGNVNFTVANKTYQPVIRLSGSNSPNCFWATTITIDPDDWASVTLPADLQGASASASPKNKVIAVSVTANQSYSSTTTIRPNLDSITTAINKNDKVKDALGGSAADIEAGAEAGRIANCWYVDYEVAHDKIWVYNGQNSKKTLNIIVAALI